MSTPHNAHYYLPHLRPDTDNAIVHVIADEEEAPENE